MESLQALRVRKCAIGKCYGVSCETELHCTSGKFLCLLTCHNSAICTRNVKKKKKRNNFRSIAQYVSSFTFNKVCQKSSTSVVLKSTCQCQKLPTEYHLEIWRLGNVITYDNKENLKQISQTAPTSQSLTFVWKLEGSLHYDCHYHNVTLVHDLQNNTAFYFFLLCKLASVP